MVILVTLPLITTLPEMFYFSVWGVYMVTQTNTNLPTPCGRITDDVIKLLSAFI